MCTGHAQIFSVNELELDSWALQYIYLSICPNKFLDTEYICEISCKSPMDQGSKGSYASL